MLSLCAQSPGAVSGLPTLPEFVLLHDVRVLELPGDLGFGREPQHAPGRRVTALQQHLHRDTAPDVAVAHGPHRTHAAPTDLAFVLVVAGRKLHAIPPMSIIGHSMSLN